METPMLGPQPRSKEQAMATYTDSTERIAPDAPVRQTEGAYAALGRFSFRHRRAVLIAWALLFVVGIALGGMVFGRLTTPNGGASTESIKGFNVLDKAITTGPSIVVVVDGPPVNAPDTRAAVQRLTAKLAALPDVTSAVNAYSSPDPRLRATDGKGSLIVLSMRKTDNVMAEHGVVDQARSAVRGQVPGATVRVGGDLAVDRDGMTATQKDLLRGNLIALPILLVALFFIFRGWRAALLPIFAALVTLAGALLILYGITQFTDVANYALDVIILFGLALAVDYSLLMVNRFREERATTDEPTMAVARTVATAGRTVTFSALTVAAALAGLFAFGDPTFNSLAFGGIATVLVALAAGLTLIPALLAVWSGKIKLAARETADDGFFGRLARRVQRRPWLVAGAVTAILLAAAIPFLGVVYGSGDPHTLPRGADSRQVAETLLARFPGKQADPVQVVGRVPATDPRVIAYASQVKKLPGVAAVEMQQGLSGNVSAINVIPTGSSQGSAARNLVGLLRDQRPAYRSYVTGPAAFLMDFKAQIKHRLPYAIALIALATFVLLFLMTGSVLVPVKALIMNTLSLGASFGALVWIFQDGHLSHLLGFDAFGAIEIWVPIVVFVFAFGLSMDYEVFLLSRIKECYDECGDSDAAVANGLQRSGRIITSAALLVIIVFLGFAAGETLGIKEMGLALAIAVAVDATLVRCLLVPATMTLLGNANWWAPAPLRRLYARFGLREAPTAHTLTPLPAVTTTALAAAEPDSLRT
jgi:RND superfamily putative drug exporter